MNQCTCATESGVCQHAGTDGACDCTLARRKLEDVLREELCPNEAEPIIAHIDSCPDCKAEQRVSVALTEAVKRCCRDRAPETMREELLAKLERL